MARTRGVQQRGVQLNMAMLAVALAAAAVAAATAYTLTSTDVSSMQASVKSAFGLGDSYSTACNPCTVGDNVGALVRLIFHDAAGGGGPNGNGGMNGCIDFATSDNKGLEDVVATLDTIYTDYSDKISKADFWLLAANLAIQYASTTNSSVTNTNIPLLDASPGTLYLGFSYGRVDDETCDDSDRLPGANYNWTQMKTLFTDRMGMTTAQIVAIMGAHSLGRAESKNSGVNGGWGVLQSTFSNFYYHVLGAGPVAWANTDPTQFANWTDKAVNPATIMLTVDVEPMLSPSGNCKNFHTYTGGGNCKANSESNAILQSYAASNADFFTAFADAWQVMTEFEYSGTLTTYSSASVGSSSSLSETDKIIIGVVVGVVGTALVLLTIGLLVARSQKAKRAAAKDDTAKEASTEMKETSVAEEPK